MEDPRFSHVASDPRFKAIPKRARKVAIDDRFSSMFAHKSFQVKYAVDKRGRRSNKTSNEDLRKYYELDGKEEIGKPPSHGSDDITALSEEEDGESESELDDVINSEGESPSSSDSEEEVVLEGAGHRWAEPDPGVVFGEASSRRLAVCNMDWDRVSAEDIFVLVSSFKPRGAAILSVTIYPSDFGLQRMTQEDVAGPSLPLLPSSQEEAAEEEEGGGFSQERLREYQLQRLQYYYAVVECDSVATAEHVYQCCERVEYEHSGGCLDLRFIPDDMDFGDREAKSVATETTIPADHTPADFISSALQQSKVKLTWDETDSHRLKSTLKNFTKEDLSTMDFSAYLASSDSEGGEGGEGSEGGDTSGEEGEVTKTAVDKYRALLLNVKEANKDDKEEIEITWEPGLRETATELVKKKKGERSSAGLSVWEQRQQDKKLKAKERRRKQPLLDALPSNTEPDDEGEGGGDLGFNDPFFQHDVAMATAKSGKKAKKSKVSLDEQGKSELELLMVDGGGGGEEEEGRRHFNLSDLLKQEREDAGKKKRKRRRGGREEEEGGRGDSFKVDVGDPRFTALYHSHSFAPDPTHPQYKATKGMGAIMAEKQKRLVEGGHQLETDPPHKQGPPGVFSDPSVGPLVRSVQSKASSFNDHRRTRKKVKS